MTAKTVKIDIDSYLALKDFAASLSRHRGRKVSQKQLIDEALYCYGAALKQSKFKDHRDWAARGSVELLRNLIPPDALHDINTSLLNFSIDNQPGKLNSD